MTATIYDRAIEMEFYEGLKLLFYGSPAKYLIAIQRQMSMHEIKTL